MSSMKPLHGCGDLAALKGLKVLSLSHVVAGPFAAALLADFGADVVHVEQPGIGDPARQSRGEPATRSRACLPRNSPTSGATPSLSTNRPPPRRTSSENSCGRNRCAGEKLSQTASSRNNDGGLFGLKNHRPTCAASGAAHRRSGRC